MIRYGAVILRQLGVAPVTLHQVGFLGLAQVRVAQGEQGDFGPHHGAVRLVQGEQGQAFKITAVFQVGVQHPVRQRRFLAGFQVHKQESQIIHHVDPAERLVELDAVKHRHLIIEHGNVGQVQVAMTFAHQPVFPSVGD